jgi:hypothetical protein
MSAAPKRSGTAVVTLPIQIPSLANMRTHHMALWRLKKGQQEAVALACRAPFAAARVRAPCIVTLVRIGPKPLDGDNLQAACKAVRDAIAKLLDIDDGDVRIEWRYQQERRGPKDYGLLVRVEPR